MSHVKLPKQLFEDKTYHGISLEAKVLYAFLADRTSLSRRNGARWQLENGEVFVIFTLEESMRVLGCGHDKAVKTFKELREKELIKSIRRGMGRPNVIVVDMFLVD